MKRKKIKIATSLALSLVALHLILPTEALAHCPLCVAGAGAGLSLSRLIGIDDTITGIWMAAFLGAMSLWFSNSLKRSYIPLQGVIIYITIFTTTILSFFQFGLVNEHNGLILNTPKLIFGMLIGGVLFYVVDVANRLVKKMHNKVYFPYQSVIVSLGSMVLASIVMLYVINFLI